MPVWGYPLFTGVAAVAVSVAVGWPLVAVLLGEVVFGWATGRGGLRLLRRRRFWLLILTAVAAGPFLIGEPDVTWGPLSLSREGWEAGLLMAGRALGLTLAVTLGLGALSLSETVSLCDRLGWRGLGFALALAMNSLGVLREMATVTLQTLYLRGGARRPWLSLRLFLVTTIANTLRYGDEVVNGALVRAFEL